MITERSKQEKSRHDQPAEGEVDLLGYGLSGMSSSMAPVASSSGSSNASGSGSGSPREGAAKPTKVVMQTNNPYAAVLAPEPVQAVLPDRYIVDEPEDDSPPVAVSHGVPIGDKNPFGHYMKQREESVDVPTPKVPSAKALGKLRRVSGQDSE